MESGSISRVKRTLIMSEGDDDVEKKGGGGSHPFAVQMWSLMGYASRIICYVCDLFYVIC